MREARRSCVLRLEIQKHLHVLHVTRFGMFHSCCQVPQNKSRVEEGKATETDQSHRHVSGFNFTLALIGAEETESTGSCGFLAPNLFPIPLFPLVPGPGRDPKPQIYM